jgi:imidazolonepropionase-like amidohydrolase
VELGKHNLEQARITLAAAREAGVTLAMGFDSTPLRSATNELLAMIDFGLPPGEALVAATSGSAAALGLSQLVGTVSAGRRADLVAVDGDPLAEPGLLCDRSRIWLVMQGGAAVAGSALEAP